MEIILRHERLLSHWLLLEMVILGLVLVLVILVLVLVLLVVGVCTIAVLLSVALVLILVLVTITIVGLLLMHRRLSCLCWLTFGDKRLRSSVEVVIAHLYLI